MAASPQSLSDIVENKDDYWMVLSEIIKESIHYVTLHPVKLNLAWSEVDIESDHLDFEFSDKLSDDDLNNVKNICEDLSWDTVLLPKKHLVMYSCSTGNSDVRGGGCGDEEFDVEDFVWEITNENGITLKDLTEAAYRLKGSKYDYWYELYEGIRLEKETKKGYHVEINYGYGS